MFYFGTVTAEAFFESIENVKPGPRGTFENLMPSIAMGVLTLCAAAGIIVGLARALFAAVGMPR